MSFIPLLYRRNKLVNIGVKSPTLDYDIYFLKIILEDGSSYTTMTEQETCVNFNILINKDAFIRHM